MTNWATKAEAAQHVRLSEKAIAEAVRAGDLKAYRAGKGNRDYRLDLAEVDEWMKSRTFEPEARSA